MSGSSNTSVTTVDDIVSTPSVSRYAHIDAMRALAVMLVVIAHAGWGAVIPGGSGVTIFFSISGFIIALLLLDEKDKTGAFKIRAFYVRRALKIGPPLFVCVLIPTLVLALFTEIDWTPVVGIAFFYYNWLVATGGADAPLPGSGVVWSLSIEEQFYLAFAVIWLLTVKSRVRLRWLAVLAAGAAVVSLGTRIALASSSDLHADRIYFGSDTRIDGIAIGVLSAIAFHHSRQHSGKVRSLVGLCTRDCAFVAAVLLYLASLAIRDEWFRDTFRFTFQSVAACLVILYGFGLTRSRLRRVFDSLSRNKVVQMIGLASYSVYLIHLTTIYFLQGLTVGMPNIVSVLALAMAGTCAGIFVYATVELPIQRMRSRRSPSRAQR